MRKEHLTHEEMQGMIIQSIRDEEITAHLAICRSCREEVAAYRAMIPILETLPAATFDFDVAEMVLENLPERNVGVSVGMVIVYILAGAGVVIGLGGLVLLTRFLQFNLVAALGAMVIVGFLGMQLKEMVRAYHHQISLLERNI